MLDTNAGYSTMQECNNHAECSTSIYRSCKCYQALVSEPDPRKKWKAGVGDSLGWKCTMCLECSRTSDLFMIAAYVRLLEI